MNTRFFHFALALCCMSLAAPVYAQQTAGEQSADPANDKVPATETKAVLAEGEFTVTATGAIQIDREKHSPIYADFDGSPVLTERLRAALKDLGLEVASERSAAKAYLSFRGNLVLLGGPNFYKGVKVSVGNVTEKALKEANGKITTADVVGAAAGVALNRAAFSAAMNNFSRGLAISGMVDALGDAGGMRGWFNTAVAGDPRGVCLSKCEDWKKVNQTVYLFAALEGAGKKDEVRILIKAFSETVVPDQVVTMAVGKAVEQIQVVGTLGEEEKVGLAKEQK